MSSGPDFERILDEKASILRANAAKQEQASRISKQLEHIRQQTEEEDEKARRVNQPAIVSSVRNNAKLVAARLPFESADHKQAVMRPNPEFVPRGFLRSVFSTEPDVPRQTLHERALWILGSAYTGTSTEWETRYKGTSTTSTYKSIALDSNGKLLTITTNISESGYRGRVYPTSVAVLLYGYPGALTDDEIAPVKAIPLEIERGKIPEVIERWNNRLLGLLEPNRTRQLREVMQDDFFSEIRNIRA